MATTMTSKGQVTIPKRIREALCLSPGDGIDFNVNQEGEVVLLKADLSPTIQFDRFQSARGKAQIQWRTEELMALLREAD